MKRSATCLATIGACTLLLSAAAEAQEMAMFRPPATARAVDQGNLPPRAQDVEDDVESAVRRFGVGVVGGLGLSPELVVFGAHGTFGPIFRPNVQFRPGIEFGVGEVTTTFAVDLDVLYTFGTSAGRNGWRPYVGAGPNFGLSHEGFEGSSDGNRFDFSDTDFEAGLNIVAGARRRTGLFFELRAATHGVSNVKLLAGFNF